MAALTAKYPNVNSQTSTQVRLVSVIKAALYCKGYDGGGDIRGEYDARVSAAVSNLKRDMGVASTYPGDGVTPKVFKALLTMDAYVLVNAGSDAVQSVQRWMNGRYVGRRDFYIMPADGHHSRDVARALLYAIQYELGMPDGTANGVFGPGTQAGLKTKSLALGAEGVWAQIFTAALILNGRNVGLGIFNQTVENEVRSFQDFSMLNITGRSDYATWASLLVSYGDQSRPGTACDGVTRITTDRAKALTASGYKYVGRYLTPSTTLPEKQIQPGELETMAVFGLRCFPIYQTWSRSADYFNYEQGTIDAHLAVEWAQIFGFKPGTTIYFAVDYDAMDGEVTQYVLPHFRGIVQTVVELSAYKVGIYGPRNICQRIADVGYAATSFVSDMSSGFSGNLGYPLPTNWAFDQIVTTTVGAGAGAIEIDKNVASGRDLAQGEFNPGRDMAGAEVYFDTAAYGEQMLADVRSYLISIGVPETGGDGWTDGDWATLGGVSTGKAFEAILSYDWLFTSLARQLNLRKALIQAPVLWELRKLNPLDFLADKDVIDGDRDDSSTGWGQIFAWVAIEARNYCRTQGIINGTVLTDSDKREVWEKLHSDASYNLQTAAYLTIYNAHQIGLPRPSLATSVPESQRILARYNGTDERAEQYGRELIGLYNVLEGYNSLCRNV